MTTRNDPVVRGPYTHGRGGPNKYPKEKHWIVEVDFGSAYFFDIFKTRQGAQEQYQSYVRSARRPLQEKLDDDHDLYLGDYDVKLVKTTPNGFEILKDVRVTGIPVEDENNEEEDD